MTKKSISGGKITAPGITITNCNFEGQAVSLFNKKSVRVFEALASAVTANAKAIEENAKALQGMAAALKPPESLEIGPILHFENMK